jgi:hypothetical protein
MKNKSLAALFLAGVLSGCNGSDTEEELLNLLLTQVDEKTGLQTELYEVRAKNEFLRMQAEQAGYRPCQKADREDENPDPQEEKKYRFVFGEGVCKNPKTETLLGNSHGFITCTKENGQEATMTFAVSQNGECAVTSCVPESCNS